MRDSRAIGAAQGSLNEGGPRPEWPSATGPAESIKGGEWTLPSTDTTGLIAGRIGVVTQSPR